MSREWNTHGDPWDGAYVVLSEETMLTTLAAIALGIGVLTAVLSYLVPQWLKPGSRAARAEGLGGAVALGAGLTLALFALTLPTTPPFSPGLRLGWGLLAGGLFGLAATLGAARLAREERPWPFPSGFALSLALAAVSLCLLLFQGDPMEALLGCALGFGMVAGVVWAMAPTSEAALPVGAAGVLAVLLSGACVLGVYHFNTFAQRGWWAYPLLLAGAWLLAQAITGVLALRRGWPGLSRLPVLTGVLSAVLVAGLGMLLAQRLEAKDPVLPTLLAGLVTAALVVWLSASVAEEAPTSTARLKAGALSVLLLLFLLALTFKLLQAFGTATALLAAFGIVAASLAGGGRVAAGPVLLATMGANYLLVRLFLERIGSSAGQVEPDIHYTLVGLLLGAMLPFLYASFRERPGAGRAVSLGLLAIGSPVVLATLWGGEAAVGFLAGLVVAPALAAFLPVAPGVVGLVSLGMALIAVQLGPVFGTLYELPRMEKVYLASGLALVVVVWIALLGLVRLRAARLRPQEG